MGDYSEYNGLIVVGTFLAVTVLLIGWMPTEFYTLAETRTITVPNYFESSSVINMNTTYELQITSDQFTDYWGKEEFGHDMLFTGWKHPTNGKYYMGNEHGYRLLGIYTGGHAMEFVNDNGISREVSLWEDEIEEDWDADAKLAHYKIQCKHFYMEADISYNTSLYYSVHHAWSNHDIHVVFGIEWSQKGTSMDAWSLIASILFFKLPNVNIYLNALIAIPLWIAISYLSFILVLRAIGAVFGGGGA